MHTKVQPELQFNTLCQGCGVSNQEVQNQLDFIKNNEWAEIAVVFCELTQPIKLGIILENKAPDELLDILVVEVLDFLSGMASYL